MLEEIIERLADNYQDDEEVLEGLLDEAQTIALSISNRQNTEDNLALLKPYIEEYVIATYLNRGAEGLNSLNDSGKNSSFKSPKDVMRNNIVKDGLRRIC